MDVTRWNAAEWAAFGAVAAVVVYIVLGAIALRQLSESKRLRELQTRPYVLVDFYFKGFFVMLEIRNIGTTPARDIEVAFDKPLEASDDRRADFSIFDTPIPMMAPGRTVRLPMGSGPAFFKENSSTPLSYVAQIKYTDMTGRKRYDDPPLILDLEPYKHTTAPPDNAGDLVAAVRDIRTTLSKWSTHHGLRVVATDRLKFDRRQNRWDTYYDARRALREGGVKHLWTFGRERLLYKLR
jgi:hypothetical protein